MHELEFFRIKTRNWATLAGHFLFRNYQFRRTWVLDVVGSCCDAYEAVIWPELTLSLSLKITLNPILTLTLNSSPISSPQGTTVIAILSLSDPETISCEIPSFEQDI